MKIISTRKITLPGPYGQAISECNELAIEMENAGDVLSRVEVGRGQNGVD